MQKRNFLKGFYRELLRGYLDDILSYNYLKRVALLYQDNPLFILKLLIFNYAFDVSDLKNTNPKPKVSIQWKGNIPKSFSRIALYNPKRKYNISKNSTIILGDSFVLIYLLFFQLSLRELMLNLGVRTNSLRLPVCPSNTAIELWKEKPSATEKNVTNSFT